MANDQQSNLVVVLNANKVLEYFRDRPLSQSQLIDLETMDRKMNSGLQLGSRRINNPNPQDKATYVANLLVTALTNEEESKVAITCAYLATRFRDLKQIKADMHSGQLSIQLIFDEQYREAAPIKFIPKEDLN